MFSPGRWHIILIFMSFLGVSRVHAQTFEDGYQSYVRNQFPVAELQFKSALKKAKADEDRAFILKFIGICQYMRGDKKSAQTSFIQAVDLDKNVQVDEEEVLDASIVPFFNTIKSRVNSEAKKKPSPSAAAPKAKIASPKLPSKKVAPKPATKKSRDREEGSSVALEAQEAKERERPRSGKEDISVFHFLPFGSGQFYNDSPWWGSAFAAAQVGSIILILDADSTIKEREDLNAVVANKEGLSDDQRNDFYAQNNDYIASIKKDKSTYQLAFLALWAAGVTEAIINRPSEKNRSIGSNDYILSPTLHEGRGSWVAQWKMDF